MILVLDLLRCGALEDACIPSPATQTPWFWPLIIIGVLATCCAIWYTLKRNTNP